MNSSAPLPDLPSPPPGFTLRAPWPDELPRFRTLFHLSRLPGTAHPRVLLRGEPERIVGGFLLIEPSVPGRPGGLLLRVRPAYLGGPAHEALLSAANELGRSLGLDELTTRLAPASPEAAFLRARGARRMSGARSYEGDLSAAARRLGRLRKRLGSAADGRMTRDLRPEDHAALATMAAGESGLGAEHIDAFLRAGREAGQCLLCVEGELPVGALLARPAGRARIHVEGRLIHPARAANSGLINLSLLAAACERWAAAGFTHFTLDLDPDKDREGVRFSRRTGCRPTGEQELLGWPL